MSMWPKVDGTRSRRVDAVDAEQTGRGDTSLLDVRNADEWEAGHAPGAQWIPLGELERPASSCR